MSSAQTVTDQNAANLSRVDTALNNFIKEITAYVLASNNSANAALHGLARLKQAEQYGTKSQCFIGDLHITSDTSISAILKAMMQLPSPLVNPRDERTYTEKYLQENSPAFSRGAALAEQEKWDEAAEHYWQAAAEFLPLDPRAPKDASDNQLNNLDDALKKAESVYYYMGNRLEVSLKKIFNNTTQINADSKRLESYLLHARDAGLKYKSGLTHPEAIPILQGMATLINDQQKAATTDLRSCHLLGLHHFSDDGQKQQSLFVHHDTKTSHHNADNFNYFIDCGYYEADYLGANAYDHWDSVENLIDSVFSLAASGKKISITRAQILLQDDCIIVSACYHGDTHSYSSHAPTHHHVDELLGQMLSAWTTYNEYSQIPLIYDARQHQQLTPMPLPVTSGVANTLQQQNAEEYLQRKIRNDPDYSAFHFSHVYSGLCALKKAINEAQEELKVALKTDKVFMKKFAKVKKIKMEEDVTLEDNTDVQRYTAELHIDFAVIDNCFPCFIGENRHAANNALLSTIKSCLLTNQKSYDDYKRSYDYIDVEYLNRLAHSTMGVDSSLSQEKNPWWNPRIDVSFTLQLGSHQLKLRF